MADRPFESLDSVTAEFAQLIAAAEQRTLAEIEEFKSALDDKGNLLHPHFDALEDIMGQIVESAAKAGEPVPPLKGLYETAVSLVLEMATARKQ